MAWSPDNREIVYSTIGTDRAQILDIQTGHIRALPGMLGDERATQFFWSPFGDWIAYDNNDKIFLTQANSGKSFLFIEREQYVEPYFWLVVPLPFAAGEIYAVTQAGANLNVRQQPGLEEAVVQKLHPGDEITILSAEFREADGYEWWNVTANDSHKSGWIVNNPDWLVKK